MLVLGIETTCDETSCSIVQDGKTILSNVLSSQIDLHALYGGVFPELASRRHLEVFFPVLREALQNAQITKEEIDLIAVAKGPGLIGPLLIGTNIAKGLSLSLEKPIVFVNHVEAHLYAAMMAQENFAFPALGIVISGGHTFFVKMDAIGSYLLLGTTVDDAIGEAFDKVGTMLGLPYPGGPKIEQLAKRGDANRFPFKTAKVKNQPWNLSFSGLKTNVLYTLRALKNEKEVSEREKEDLAASFQQSAFSALIEKTQEMLNHFSLRALYIGGGVSCNLKLRELFAAKFSSHPIFWPPKELSLDNGAMIAGLGYHNFLRQSFQSDSLDTEPMTRITNFCSPSA